MGKQLATLIEDMYSLLDPTADHIVDEANLDFFAESLKETIRGMLKAQSPRHGLRFSAIGKQPRQIWYDANEDPANGEKLDGQTIFKFLYGHMIEAAVVLLIKESGHEYSDEQAEVSCEGVDGHLDIVVDGHVLDIKSASPYGYVKFEKGEITPEDDTFGYIRQLSGYATVKALPAAFLAVDKVGGKMCISRLSDYAVAGHPPGPRIEYLKKVIDQPQPPARCYSPVAEGVSGNMRLGTACGYCRWKAKCWEDSNGGKGLRGFAYSNSPKWFTKIAKEPNVPEFEV